MKPIRWLIALTLAGLTLLAGPASSPGYAQPRQIQGSLTMEAQAGLDGACKNQTWTPVRVRLQNAGSDLSGRLEVIVEPPGEGRTTYTQPVDLPNPSDKTVTLPVFTSSVRSLIVRFMNGEQTVASETLRLRCSGVGDRLVGLLAEPMTPFNIIQQIDPSVGQTSLARLDAASLPARAAALGALDMILIANTDTGSLGPEQQQAVAEWVSGGGMLVVSGGANWQRTISGLQELLPVEVTNSTTLPGLDALRRFSGDGAAGEVLQEDVVTASGMLKPAAHVLIQQGDTALVTAQPLGLGQVIYLAFDPAGEPFSTWAGREAFYEWLLGQSSPRPEWSRGFQDPYSAGMAAVSSKSQQIPGALPLFGLLFLYAAVIGPVNYLVVKRLKRRELAWFTTPAIVIVFALLAFFTGAVGRGRLPVLTRVGVVQVFQGAGQARVDGMVGLYSPNRATYTLQAGEGQLLYALPGTIMSQPGGSTTGDWQLAYDQSGVAAEEVRVDVAASRALALQAAVPAPQINGQVAFELDGNQMTLTGEITNASEIALEDVHLLTPGGPQEIGALGPGETRQLDQTLLLNQQAGYSSPGMTANSVKIVPVSNTMATISALAGSYDYYRNQETFRRYMLMTSLTANPTSWDGGLNSIYLAGWSSASPLDVDLAGQPFEPDDTTLYLVEVESSLSLTGETIQLDPGLFTWEILDSSPAANPSPYDAYLPQGSFSLAFHPFQPVPFQAVEELTIHMENYGDQSPLPFRVYLWDYTANDWQPQDIGSWGSHPISSPEKYVGPDGEVRLMIENPGNGLATSFQRADISMVLRP